MGLSKEVVSLMCLPILMVGFSSTSYSSIEDNTRVNSMKSITINENKVETISNNQDTKTIQLKSNQDKDYIPSQIVTYERDNITIPSNITKEEMHNVLMNYHGASTMAHLSGAFVDAEKKYGVNAFTMAGIVALESGFATSRRAVEDNNLTGYEVYSDDSEGRLFSSQYESIMQTARHLALNYLTKGGTYYKGVSVDAVQVNYCPDEGTDKNWEGQVNDLASVFLKIYNELYVKK
ncbi:glucosaminidase domain-containing protein [Romboutsia sp.]|uniref:glucosaminidase domain-containing protein n=1 Tax=Romboutsia sp. TaxID=1965302 RepID=UPI003F393948